MTRIRLLIALLSLGAAVPETRAQHTGDLLVASTEHGAGALALAYDFSRAIVVSESFSAGGITLYSSTDPGFDAVIIDEPDAELNVLKKDTQVRCEITAIDAGASVQLSGVTLDAAGESAPIGSAPNLHNHPIWRLTLPTGRRATSHLSLRLTAARGYQPSAEYTLILTNGLDAATPSPTATFPVTALPATGTPPPTATPSAPAPSATASTQETATETATLPPLATPTAHVVETRVAGCAGDCNGDGRVAVNEIITGVTIALGDVAVDACARVDGDRDGAVAINELVTAVTSALSGCPRP